MGLLTQILTAILLIVAVTVVHGTGVTLMDKLFRYEAHELRKKKLVSREFTLMVPMALCLCGLHVLEISIFAVFFLAVGDAESFREALYNSALAYTTMGAVEGETTKWSLVVAFEGLVGFLMIGWSAAVFVTDMEKVLRRRD